jgi:hypothetical protein
MRVKKRLIIFIGVAVILAVTGVYFGVDRASSINAPIGSTDYSGIENEVKALEKEYFEFNLTEIEVTFVESLTGAGGKTALGVFNYYPLMPFRDPGIKINKEIKDPEQFRAVFTHEYLHFVLYQMGIGENIELNEGLTHTFTWYVNRETMARTEGAKAEHRKYPYNLIIGPILNNNNFDCLDKVFTKENKIKSIEDYKNRLKVNCNIDV